MTIEIIEDTLYIEYLLTGTGETAESTFYFDPYPAGGVQARYLNKCIDGVSSEWVHWETTFQDLNGTQYPGSSFDSGTYRVATIVYDRDQ